ncbi:MULTISPECIES: hypothetical protein [Nostocales]|uniref:Uncharacterized protein n=2 Tax=Nostocales TaxID=1161 RepID=A0A8S9TG68_9CYAN|nr:hypothetical protein [Tolypothrix bouteillei]KAF3891118.1 hypothetical protein DA73_0400024925 [Tolypothrix bouteillei VB521301]
MHKRCDRNRKRSKRRAIYCPIQECYLDSMSQKHPLFADRASQLQQRGASRQKALILVAKKTAVSLEGEWLEAFWCDLCQKTKWYHVKKQDCIYEVSIASPALWRQAVNVIHIEGNPSVSEFTRRHARNLKYNSKDF